jgi:23S rRNA (pseudouridine1915-N3)-methyltransferase
MDLRILAVGRLRPALHDACDDYRRRLGRFARVTEREVREAAGTGAPRRNREGEALLRGLPPDARLVALDAAGRAWSSTELAREVARWREGGRAVALAIGGAEGHGEPVLARAGERWSLGPLTLPHELVRVIVYEQLYRAFTFLEGHPYHRA